MIYKSVLLHFTIKKENLKVENPNAPLLSKFSLYTNPTLRNFQALRKKVNSPKVQFKLSGLLKSKLCDSLSRDRSRDNSQIFFRF